MGSWDLVSKVINTITLRLTLIAKSHGFRALGFRVK